MTSQIIIGNGVCGTTAALSLVKQNPDLGVTLISEEPFPCYARMLLPDYIAGLIPEEKLFPFREDQFASIRVILGRRVEEVCPQENAIVIEGKKKLFFENLLIASGAAPWIPDIEGIGGEGIYPIRGLRESREIILHANAAGKKAVILGGGLVGLEATNALVNRGFRVEMIVGSPQVLSRLFDERSAGIIEDYLREKRIVIYKNRKAVGIDFIKGKKTVLLNSGEEVSCDLVIIAKGAEPTIDFIDGNSIAIDEGIIVNRRMQTNIPNIYAAGDVAMAPDFFEENPIYNATWGGAIDQGLVAANNMAGGGSLYEGDLRANIFEVLGLRASCIGQGGRSDETCEIFCSDEMSSHKRLVFKEGTLVGALLIGDIEESGILQQLIKERISLRGAEETFLRNRTNFARLLRV